jgi:hypothetical protein
VIVLKAQARALRIRFFGVFINLGSRIFRIGDTIQQFGYDGLPKDDCYYCRGARHGVPGNENVINGKLVCDYCSVDQDCMHCYDRHPPYKRCRCNYCGMRPQGSC